MSYIEASPRMAKTGRPRRQDARRDTEGRVMRQSSPDRQEDPRTLGQWNRYRDHCAALMMDGSLASLRGRMFFTKQITAPQFQAANFWANMLDDYDLIVLGKRRSPASAALEKVSQGEANIIDPERVEAFRARFDAAHAALLCAGKLSENAVNRICRDEGVGGFFDEAMRGLDALVVHFQLTGKKTHGKWR